MIYPPPPYSIVLAYMYGNISERECKEQIRELLKNTATEIVPDFEACSCAITHWMPLPEPPKEEKDDDGA